MKASVIVLSWNGKPYLEDCLSALLAQSYPDFEVILVDNASTDGSADFVAERFPRVRIIRNSRNLGFAAGMNVGLKAAQGEILVLLNQDTVVGENWLTALVEAMAADREVGVAGCKILYPDGRTIQHAGARLDYPLGFAHHYGYGELDQGQYDILRPVDYVTGAAMGIKREVVEKIGYLDEDFFPAYFEDVEFCLRAREAGYKVIYVPQAVLIHHESSSTDRESYDQNRYYHKNRLLCLLKHYASEQFATDLWPAERERLKIALPFSEVRALDRAYLENLLSLPGLSGVEKDRFHQLSEAMQAWRTDLGGRGTVSPVTDETFESVRDHAETLRSRYGIVLRLPVSTKSVLGPLVTFVRRNLLRLTGAEWYVNSIVEQQLEFNAAVVRFGDRVREVLGGLIDWVTEIEARLRDGYTERTIIAGNVVSLGHRMVELEDGMDERLKAIDERLERIERALEKMND